MPPTFRSDTRHPLHAAIPASRPSTTTAAADAYHSSGQSPGPAVTSRPRTLHLLGPGQVGRALLAQLATLPVRVVAVSDSTATAFDRDGLPVEALLAHKAQGRPLRDWPHAEALPTDLAVQLVDADLVVDATPTKAADTAAAVRRGRAALHNGAFLALCGKNALAAAPEWLTAFPGRIGIHAVLGGTGQSLVRELPELQATCQGLALVGNVTTTLLITAIEQGCSLAEGIERAQAQGLLEPDPTLDLDGSDAATKLRAVWGAVFGAADRRAPDVDEIPRDDIRALDPTLVRARALAGNTTRLVARGNRDGTGLRVAFEQLPLGSPLAAPPDRVVYAYQLPTGQRVHTGLAVGHERTAAALLADLRQAIAAEVRR